MRVGWGARIHHTRSAENFFNTYKIKTVKIGIVPSFFYLEPLFTLVKQLSPTAQIVWDTVAKILNYFWFFRN
jgi:hydroxymethylpyrimidine/phosphomethylpyrimidine kinase